MNGARSDAGPHSAARPTPDTPPDPEPDARPTHQGALGAARAWKERTFHALRWPHFRRYWQSQMLSLVGSWMQTTAQSYLVLELTNNNSAALGWVTVAQFTPSLLLSLFAGAVIDRAPRRRILLATQSVLMVTALVLAVTTHLGVVTLPLVMVLAFVSGMANAFDMPARQTLASDFVPREDFANAVALNSLSFNVSRTLGQAVFGVVAALGVTLLGGGNADNLARLAVPFYLNVASFVVVLWVIATLPFPPRETGGRPAVLTDIAEGLRYVRRTPSIRNTLILLGLLSLTIINFNVIIPYFARAVYGLREAGFGFLNASFGVGAMIGALWQASRPNPLRNLRLGAVLLLASGLALAVAPGGVIAAAVLACCGFAMLTFLISANSSVQLTVPNALRGRVMSLYSLVLVGSAPLGAIISSSMIAQGGPLGPKWGLAALAGVAGVCVLALWRHLPRTLPPQTLPPQAQPPASQLPAQATPGSRTLPAQPGD
ncbi:MFS transporter [Deinococcus aquiradiocola]|uniref:MFS transporter n=1 Tax=Deinococcus aquiradiocola TaxID=393059 RepID=A0A917P6Y5_9DEIO|nr:MFS transporter [Deinococcus aquiradiocola]GGJ64726.1 MFS transporter [Deinococcus aquiradiocola]